MTDVQEILRNTKSDLQERFGVTGIGIFGSFVRRESTVASDIDILVEFDKPVSFFRFLRLEDHLKALLGVNVDLVEKNALKPVIGQHILKEVVYV